MMIANAAVGRAIPSGAKMASLDVGRLNTTGKESIELVLEGVRKTSDSLQLRVLLCGDSMKPIEAGRLYTYGEGPVDDTDRSGRFAPMKLSLDITEAARRLAGAARIDVYVQLLNGQGKEVGEPLFVESLQLHRRDPGGQ
jgi:hypothetical protein